MTIRDLMPWSRDPNQVQTLSGDRDPDPFMSLHREMNRLVDDMFRGFGSRLPSSGRLSS
ncbi:MAG: Hsp20/alpha crystallin family protein, partial [Mesorhizobium sp.]